MQIKAAGVLTIFTATLGVCSTAALRQLENVNLKPCLRAVSEKHLHVMQKLHLT